jgi:hypothetical protein
MRANDPLGLNSFIDDDDDLFFDRGVIRTKPVKLYNLPDSRYLVKNIEDFANGKGWLYSNIYDFFKKFPFKWLSNITSLQDEEDDAILVDPNTVPDFIKEYVYNFYGKDYGSAGFSKYVYLIKDKDITNLSHLTFNDFLQYLKKEGYKFSSLEKSSWESTGTPVYLFSGIPVKKFFELYFTSGKSHEEILRFLKDYDNIYNVDHDFIEKEVEKILSKH